MGARDHGQPACLSSAERGSDTMAIFKVVLMAMVSSILPLQARQHDCSSQPTSPLDPVDHVQHPSGVNAVTYRLLLLIPVTVITRTLTLLIFICYPALWTL